MVVSSMNIHTNTGKRSTVLYLKGAADFGNEGRIHAELHAALHAGDRLVLDLSGVTEADLSLMINICSLCRTAELLGKKISLRGVTLAPFAKVMEYAGHSRKRKCIFHARRSCALWAALWKAAGSAPVDPPRQEKPIEDSWPFLSA